MTPTIAKSASLEALSLPNARVLCARPGRDLLLLTVLFGALNFFSLGRAPLANPDEGRYAEIPREMLVSGDWVTPRLDGVKYFEKPPLVYWLVALCERTFGPSEWSLRAVPALFGLGGVLLTYGGARRIYGRLAGFASAIVLGTSLIYFAHSRLLILDMAVAVLMSATLFCFMLGVREPPGAWRRTWFYGLYASAALATLTKGLVGCLLPGAIMFLWLLIFHQWKRLRPLYLPTGIALFLAIAAPWHVLIAQRNPEWAHFYFINQHWERFTTTTHGRFQPWWWFAPLVLAGLIPWVAFLGPALRDALAGGWARRQEKADAWFLVTWAAFVFLFFSKSQSKLVPYILPVFPPLAVLIGAWLARRWEANATNSLGGGLRFFSGGCALLAIALGVAVQYPTLVHLDPGRAAGLRPFAYGLAAVLLAGGTLAPWLAATRGARATLTSIAATIILFYAGLGFATRDLQPAGTKALALWLRAHVQPGDRVFHYGDFFHDFTYYARQTVGVVNYRGDEIELVNDEVACASNRFVDNVTFRLIWRQPNRVYAVARKTAASMLFADPSFHYHLLAESAGHCLFSNQP